MLTAVEFNNQVLRNAAGIGKVGTNPVGPANLNPPQRLAPRCAHNFRSSSDAARRHQPRSRASNAQIFIFRTDKSRASEGALTKDPLSAPKQQGAVLPLSGEENSSQIVQTRVPAWKGLSHAADVHWHAARSRAERIDWPMFADSGMVSLVIGKGSELSGQMY